MAEAGASAPRRLVRLIQCLKLDNRIVILARGEETNLIVKVGVLPFKYLADLE